MRYLIKFSYDGTNFYGFQKQTSKRSIQEELEKAVTYINNKRKTKVTSSGRTDKKVHALNQTAHFDLETNITLDKLKKALNSLLPDDINVSKVKKVKNNFHARYMVKEKTYKYYLNMGEYDPILRQYIYQYNHKLNIDKMKKAINYFVGTHNFKAFVSEEAQLDNYTRTITKVSLKKKKEILEFTFTGNGFMKYQVRNMVGTLIKIGKDKLEATAIKEILEDVSKRNLVSTAKPEGLYLIDVKY